jgi:signal transduction histidine kinase
MVSDLPLSLQELLVALSRLRTRDSFQNEIERRLGALLRVSGIAFEIEPLRLADNQDHQPERNRICVPLQFSDGYSELVIYFGIPQLSRRSREILYQTIETILYDLFKIASGSGPAELLRLRKEHSLTPNHRLSKDRREPWRASPNELNGDDSPFAEPAFEANHQRQQVEQLQALPAAAESLDDLAVGRVTERGRDSEPASPRTIEQFFHRLRNSLTAIMSGSSQLLASNQSSFDPDDRALVKVISRAGALQRDLIDRYSILCSPPKLTLKAFGLQAVLRSIIDQYDSKSGRKTEIAAASDDVALTSDSLLLGQIITELLNNGYEAGGAEPISVRWSIAHSRAAILIKNRNRAESDEFPDKFFQPFFTSKQDHSGLGLAIAREYATALGGTIKGVSLRGYTVVALCLPISQKE